LWRRLHSGRAGTWGPFLIGVYGVGLIVVGIFTTDPVAGFPPGAATPAGPSWHGAIHAFVVLFTFLFLTAALAVLARLFVTRKERGWAFYCLASALSILVLFFGGINSALLMARFLRLATLIGWLAASLIAIRLLTAPETSHSTLAR